MPRKAETAMALTADLVALTRRVVEDTGPPADTVPNGEADWDAAVRQILDRRPAGQDVWVFAYGSLLWNPVFDPVEQRVGIAPGWHRSFRMRIRSWRGTLEQPGLMMGLDRGGQCKGVALRIAEEAVEADLGRLVRREMPIRPVDRPPTYVARWIDLRTPQEHIRALAFIINPRGHTYAGRLTPDQTAEILARACGHGGSCAEYLYNTVRHLEQMGIRDRNLWHLQALVAQKIRSISALSDEAVLVP